MRCYRWYEDLDVLGYEEGRAGVYGIEEVIVLVEEV